MKLITRIFEKPWGQDRLPAMFDAVMAGHQGQRIGEIWFEQSPEGLGSEVAPALDVMVKYLFTSERLSIQVHPDDAQARERGYPRGKEEVWVVLEASEDAHIGIGLTREASADELRAAALDGSLEQLIDWRPAKAGDIWYNPAGTIHAIGPGLVVVEVQQAVDLTYRLYDYGRPRELHLDDGLAVAIGRPHHDRRDGCLPDRGSALLVDGPHFALAWCDGEVPDLLPSEATFQVIPITGEAGVAGEIVRSGECGLTMQRSTISISRASRALIAWSLADGKLLNNKDMSE